MEENTQKTNENKTDSENKVATKTYTQEEVDALVQSEADKRVNQALQRKEREINRKLTEAEKLAKMSEEDQLRYKLDQKEKELAAKESEFALKENKIEAMKVLSERNLPTELVEFVLTDDAETMLENITTMEKIIKNVVNAEVKSKIQGQSPRTGSGDGNKVLTHEEFMRLPMVEKNRIYKEDKDLYNKLMNKQA